MAVFSVTVNDSAGHRDTGTTRTISVVVTNDSGHTDVGARIITQGTINDRAGHFDTVIVGTTTGTTFTRTVTDDAGHSDSGQVITYSDVETVDDSAGMSDSVIAQLFTGTVPPPPNISLGLPQLVVQMAIGGATPLDPAAGSFILGTSQLGTGTLGSIAWVDVTADARSVSISPSPGGITDTASPGSATIMLENLSGDYDPENPASPYLIDVGQHVRIRAGWNGVMYSLFYGYIDEVAPDYGWDPTVVFACTDGLAQLGRAKVRPQAVPVFPGERTDQRLGHILSEADWPATLRSLDRGVAQCQGDTYGDFGLPLAQRIVDSEFGEHYIDGDGRYVFLSRTHVYTATRSTTVQALFTDSGTDIDMDGVTSTRSRGELYNQALVTRNGGVEQFYEDTTSRGRYGPQTFPRSTGTMLNSDTDAADLTRWIVVRFRQPGQKVESLSIDATAQGMWAVLLPLRRYDRIRLQRTYGTNSVLVDKQVLIEGMAWSITSGSSWSVTITTRPVDNSTPFVLGFSTLGTGVLV